MIESSTVFILGAGASKPYRFPTGRELRNEILKFESEFEYHFNNVDTYEAHEIKNFCRDFVRRFQDSGIYSIDKFLAFNPTYSLVGKFAIALRILAAESQSRFDEKIGAGYQNIDWYSFLYNRMLEDIHPGDNGHMDFSENNKVSFISFNYDRSLEWYIHRSFTNLFGGNSNALTPEAKFITFPFYHVYGAALLPWQILKNEKNDLMYQIGKGLNQISFEDVKKMADCLRIIFDDRQKNVDPIISELIKSAKRVFFLGFGYADENLNILGIPESIDDKEVFGTAMGFTPTEIKRIIHKLCPDKEKHYNEIIYEDETFKKRNVKILDVDSLSLLREFL